MAKHDKRFAGMFSRTKQRIANNLGIIGAESHSSKAKYRDKQLDVYDAYYESRQYDHLLDWDEAVSRDDEYIGVRQRKPRVLYALPKVLVDRVAAKLVGKSVYPTFNIEDDPDATTFLGFVQRAAEMQPRSIKIIKQMLTSGSAFARFKIVEGDLQLECYNPKYVYPKFDAKGDLSEATIQYVYEDPEEKDEKGNPVKKWYKLELGLMTDTLFDNPRFSSEQEPVFTPVETAQHDLGFVQGEWFRTDEQKHTVDGVSLYADAMTMFDELNYGLSQSSQAVSYNHEPLLTLKGLDIDPEDKDDPVIRSSTKALFLGRDGEAGFLEADMTGVEAGYTLRDRVKAKIGDVCRVVMLDPEKIVGSAQSGKAMEVLHGPLVELIDELRGPVEKCLKKLIIKMAVTLLMLNEKGLETEVVMPAGWKPTSLEISVTWPPIFPLTLEDLQKKVAVMISATNASVLSRETGTRWLAKDFGIEDIEAEVAKIAAQPVLNPFGAF